MATQVTLKTTKKIVYQEHKVSVFISTMKVVGRELKESCTVHFVLAAVYNLLT